MPYKLIWEPKGVYWKYVGKVSGKEVIETSTSIYGDPRFDNLKYKLVDFRDIDSIDMDKDEIALIAYQHKAAGKSNPNIKNAIVIKTKYSKLANLFSSFFIDSAWEVQVFNNIEKANEWLERKPSD